MLLPPEKLEKRAQREQVMVVSVLIVSSMVPCLAPRVLWLYLLRAAGGRARWRSLAGATVRRPERGGGGRWDGGWDGRRHECGATGARGRQRYGRSHLALGRPHLDLGAADAALRRAAGRAGISIGKHSPSRLCAQLGLRAAALLTMALLTMALLTMALLMKVLGEPHAFDAQLTLKVRILLYYYY